MNPDVTFNAAADLTSAIVTYSVTAADNIGVTSLSCSPASGSQFAVGSTTVTCTASDAAGNTAITTFNVIVKDVTPPAFAPTPDVMLNAAANATGANVTYSVAATDAVGVVSQTCSPASGTAFNVGLTVVTAAPGTRRAILEPLRSTSPSRT